MHFNYSPFEEEEELLFTFENKKECQEFLDTLYQKLINCRVSDDDKDGQKWQQRSLDNVEKIKAYLLSDDETLDQLYEKTFERSAALRDDFNYWDKGQRLFRMGDGNDLEIRHYANALFDFIDMQG